MPEVVVILGLPGSGKTMYAQDYYEYYHKFDDPSRCDITFYMMCEAIKAKKNVVVTDIPTSLELITRRIKECNKQVKIKFVFFENNLRQCIINNRERFSSEFGKKVTDWTITTMSKDYKNILPEDVEAVPVYVSA